MRYFVVCNSLNDGQPYILGEVADVPDVDPGSSLAAGIAGDAARLATREQLGKDGALRLALLAWDNRDDDVFDRETAALEDRADGDTVIGMGAPPA